jgi:hypothetical protein
MQFVAGGDHVRLTNQAPVGFRVGIDVDDADRIGPLIFLRVD